MQGLGQDLKLLRDRLRIGGRADAHDHAGLLLLLGELKPDLAGAVLLHRIHLFLITIKQTKVLEAATQGLIHGLYPRLGRVGKGPGRTVAEQIVIAPGLRLSLRHALKIVPRLIVGLHML